MHARNLTYNNVNMWGIHILKIPCTELFIIWFTLISSIFQELPAPADGTNKYCHGTELEIGWYFLTRTLKKKKQNEYNLLSSNNNNNCPLVSIFQLTKCFYTLASILSQILSMCWENFVVSSRFLLTSHVVTVTGWLCQLMTVLFIYIYDTPIFQRPKLSMENLGMILHMRTEQ